MQHVGAHHGVHAVDRGARTALVAHAHAGSVRGELLGDALDVLHGHAGDLGILLDGVGVDRFGEDGEAGAHFHAVDFALEVQHALAAVVGDGGLARFGVDAHELVDGLAVLVRLLRHVHAGVGGAHQLFVVGMALVVDDEERGVGERAVAARHGRLLVGEGQRVGVVGFVGDHLLDEGRAERRVGGRLDGNPIDAGKRGRHAAVCQRAVQHVDLQLAGGQVGRRALAGALEVDHATAGEGAQPDSVFGLFRIGGEAGTRACQRTR